MQPGGTGINVARASRQSNLLANLRAEGYWRLRELFAAGQISIPNHNQLMGELAALRYSYDSQGRIIMEARMTKLPNQRAGDNIGKNLRGIFHVVTPAFQG